MPKGLSSSVPGLGIQTRRVGLTLEPRLILFIKVKRCFGVSDFAPSTPAVFFPWLSWVTRRTAKALAVQDFINNFWSLRTNLTSPRLDAWYILFCNLKTLRSSFRQLISLHSYIGFLAVFMTYTLLLVAIPSVLPWVRQHILTITVRRWLLTQSLPPVTWISRCYVLADYSKYSTSSRVFRWVTSFLITFGFVPLGCHLFTEFLGNVGMSNEILIPPFSSALLGLPA